jgi:hypothetical protein
MELEFPALDSSSVLKGNFAGVEDLFLALENFEKNPLSKLTRSDSMNENPSFLRVHRT